MPTRKRFNAFEDQSQKSQPQEDLAIPFSTPEANQPQDQIERIERLKPSQMLPDRFQPRRLLPPRLRAAFFAGEMDCYTAASEWLEMARADTAIQSELERLQAMGDSFQEHGQIKPITGSWVAEKDGAYIFQIETGERRFWAACLQKVQHHQKEEPLLRVEVVAKPTRQRQVLENRHAEPPSAVEQACEVASLILAELGKFPDPNEKDEYVYFRSVHNQRMPTGMWDHIIPIMQLTRPRMVQLLNVLQLPTPLLDYADRYRLPERVLREVLAQPADQWERVLQLSAQSQLTAEEVAAVAVLPAATPSGTPPRPAPSIPDHSLSARRSLRRFTHALIELDEVSRSQALDQIADDLVITRQAEGMINIFEELSQRLIARLSRINKV